MTRLTVIIPAYNREKHIGRTLESVLVQTYAHFDLILVDNASTDTTPALLQAFAERCASHPSIRVTLLSESRHGACAARNAGLRFAATDWVIFFDSDDAMHPELIERYAQAIDTHGDSLDIIHVPSRVVDAITGSTIVRKAVTAHYLACQLHHSFLSTQCYAVRRSLIEAVGAWDEKLMGWNDWELGTRLLLASERVMSLATEPLVTITSHPTSITGTRVSDKPDTWLAAIEKVRADIDRSGHPDRNRLLSIVEYRRLVVAGLCTKEGARVGKEIYEATLRHLPRRLRPLFALLYRYIAIGGKGGSHILNAALRLLRL